MGEKETGSETFLLTPVAETRLAAANSLLAYGPKFLDPVALLIREASNGLRDGVTSPAQLRELDEISAALFQLPASYLSNGAPGVSAGQEEQLIALIAKTYKCIDSLNPNRELSRRRRRGAAIFFGGLVAIGYLFGWLVSGGELDPSQWILPRYQGLRIVWAEQSWGPLKLNTSVTGGPLSVAGTTYLRGIGTHAYSKISIRLEGRHKKLSGLCGVDAQAKAGGSIVCRILAQPSGNELFNSGVLRGGEQPRAFDVEFVDAKQLDLVIEDGGDGVADDLADWADLNFY